MTTDSHAHVTLGHSPAGPLAIDLASLIGTRGFVTASSGQGKSWLIRLLLERIANRAQMIVIDPEGEFSSLRERLPMLLVGEGGELAADVRTAKLLARKLVELKLSAVIDLYDLGDWDQRRAYVAEFLTGLMNVPKALYHPIVVAIDEAHQFAAKSDGGGDEAASASRRAVNALMSAGRKRGFCGVLASQRISKIHNDAIADAKNRFIGGITLDNDQARAADELGIPKSERIKLRDLEPGEFFAYGPALPRGVTRFRTDVVATSHPQAGQRHVAEVPPAPDAIKKLVSELGDLPKQAQAEVDETTGYQRHIADLERQLRARPVQTQIAAPERIVERVEVTVFRDGEVGRLESAVTTLHDVSRELNGFATKFGAGIGLLNASVDEVSGALKATVNRLSAPTALPARNGPIPAQRTAGLGGPVAAPGPDAPLIHMYVPTTAEGRRLAKAERSILTVLAQRGPRTKRQVAVQTGYAVKGGGFGNAVSALASAGHIARAGETMEITDSGMAALGAWEALPAGQALLEYWQAQLPKAERAVLGALAEVYPGGLSKAALATATGYEAGGGGFGNALGRLRTLELVEGSKELKASEELFD